MSVGSLGSKMKFLAARNVFIFWNTFLALQLLLSYLYRLERVLHFLLQVFDLTAS